MVKLQEQLTDERAQDFASPASMQRADGQVSGRLARSLLLDRLSRSFGDVVAVEDFSLEVPGGEFLTLLGPSGCGKTTLLRMIAGLEEVSSGRILIGGQDVTDVAANRRDTSIMFQDYALFPHKTVIDNIAFGLQVRGVPRADRKRRAQELLEFIRLPDVGLRRPGELSGGQCQRIALARSLVIEPAILLLDEPLGALDANLRRHMQLELKRIQRQVGITFVCVTHDQEEALTMSDRIVVMRDGRAQQIGTPDEIYNTPRTEFVARFIGHCNILKGRVEHVEGDLVTWTDPSLSTTIACNPNRVPVTPGGPLSVALRPERILIGAAAGRAPNQARVVYRDRMFAGAIHRFVLDGGSSGEINVEARDPVDLTEGEEVLIGWNHSDALVLHPG